MTKKSENTAKQRFETAIKVDAQIPNDTLNPVVAEQIIDPVPDFRWVCSLTKVSPLLKITLWWSCPVKNLVNMHLSRDVHCIMVRSRYGKHLGGIPVNGLHNEVRNSIYVDLCEVQVGDRLLFDVVLSTSCEPVEPPVTIDRLFPSNHALLSTLLKDTSSMNMAFTFGMNGAARNIGLWAHQSVLAQESKFAELINKLQVVDGDRSDGTPAIKSHHVNDYSLEAFCCLFRYLYLGLIDLDVDLDDFAIGYPPSRSNLSSCRERPVIEDLLPSTEDPAAKRGTSWKELFELADCYQVWRLREHCRVIIVSSLDKSNAVDILFDYAYRHDDLKEQVLNFLSTSVDDFSSGDRDPFIAHKDHPQGYLLVVEMLKRSKIHAH